MRVPTLVIVCLTLATSCVGPVGQLNGSGNRPAYAPEMFRQNVTSLIAAKDYAAAVALVHAADVYRQVKYDGSGYVAIGGLKVYLPGVDNSAEFNSNRDWCMPGTSDAIEDGTWQSTATEFADQYNRRRSAEGG